MRIFVLGSGSTGNCLLIEAEGERLVLDAGLGVGRAVERMRMLGGDLVTSAPPLGVFVTHGHGDHAGHALPIARALRAPLFAHEHVAIERARRRVDVRAYAPRRPLVLGPFLVEAIALPHDAAQVALRVSAGGCGIALATDLGHTTREIRAFLARSDMVFLESNYCPAMLDVGPYPARLKSRVAGPLGHLSNEQAADVVASLEGTRASRVVLVHLSRTNNSPERALDVVTSRGAGRAGVSVEVLPHGEARRFDVAVGARTARGSFRRPNRQLRFSFA